MAVTPGDLRRNVGEVKVPKIGWVRFRWSRAVPDSVKSYRITRDRAGRWHVAFAVVPEPIAAPGTGAVVGVDRGILANGRAGSWIGGRARAKPSSDAGPAVSPATPM